MILTAIAVYTWPLTAVWPPQINNDKLGFEK